jgi:hypothetical protein
MVVLTCVFLVPRRPIYSWSYLAVLYANNYEIMCKPDVVDYKATLGDYLLIW